MCMSIVCEYSLWTRPYVWNGLHVPASPYVLLCPRAESRVLVYALMALVIMRLGLGRGLDASP